MSPAANNTDSTKEAANLAVVPRAVAFAEQLVRNKVYVLPGQICELPGYLRLSLTATEAIMTLRVGAKRHHPRAADLSRRPDTVQQWRAP
ncbi:MAG: hypothetical protein HGA45_32670 [Chloroflexales bacterium]|nr:hypothetical protein [Chloroflexales bacterium]